MTDALIAFALLCFSSLLAIINPLSAAPMYLALTEGKLPVPIIVRRTPDRHTAKIRQHLALPQDGKPLSAWPDADEFWGEVEEGLRRLIRDMMQKRGIPPLPS